MNSSPSIIAASLDDKQLKDSIEQMVQNFNNGLERMKKSADNAALEITKKLQSIGNVKIDSGGSADGGSSRRAKAQNAETKAVEETTASYDKLAQAQNQAAKSKKGIEYMTLPSDADKSLTYLVNLNKDVDAQMSAILQKENELIQQKNREAQVTKEINEELNRRNKASGIFDVKNSDDQNRVMRESMEALRRYKEEQGTLVTSYKTMSQAISGALNIGKDEIHNYDIRTASAKQLNLMLKQQQEAYSRLSTSQRSQKGGVELAENIQRIQNALRGIQSQAARPISLKSILGDDVLKTVHTLDEIAIKIRQLQAYRMGINFTNPRQKAEIDEVNFALDRLKRKQDEILGVNNKVLASNNALGRSFNYMKNRLAFYFTVGASTQFVKQIINIRGQYELLERSIGILFDSMQTGTKIFSELNAMAIKSPFTTMELGAAAKQLSAYNIAAKDVVDTTRRLADMAAAVGVPIERLTYALGQIKSYGYLNSRDARMFANAGIPLIQNLADMYTKLEGRMVSIGDVYDRIKHKQVSFEDTLKVVNEMTDEGGRFFNFQEKAADTLVVKLANLTLAWNNMMNEMGKSNSGMINSSLSGLKTLMQNWRTIDNLIWAAVSTLGLYKLAQLAILAYHGVLVKQMGWQILLGKKLTSIFVTMGRTVSTLAVNPFFWLTAVITGVSYLLWQWWDLSKANDALNKSISDGAQENINSINKFFDKYRKEIESIGSAKSTDQEKMWERIRDEIEKTTKNAQQYIDILEKIPNAAERVERASGFLEHQKAIQQEAKRMADHGMFDMGGGFADDSLAKDLQEYEKELNKVIAKYDTIEAGQKALAQSKSPWSATEVGDYNQAVKEAEEELDKFTAILDKANIAKIMGDGSDEEQLANIRSFAQLIRDNFLATEEGQKISTEGQARLNKEIDYWIAQQGVSNGLINAQRAEIESNRSAWENFFTYLNEEDKKALEYLVSTGQLESDEFKKIWEKAAGEMKNSSMTAYEQIQSHIADLRKTAPIVIDVIYREKKETQTEAQKEFTLAFLTPDQAPYRSAEDYLEEQKKLSTQYSRFNQKAGEDTIEWEKRLGQEYQDNEKKLKSYNNILKEKSKLSDEDKKKQEGLIKTITRERDEIQSSQDALKKIQAWGGFDYEQFKKGGKKGGSKKDVFGDALKEVVDVTNNMQKRFKEYKKAGVDANTALEESTNEYSGTLENANKTLEKYGVKATKKGSELAKMDMRDLRNYYETLLAIAKGVGNTKGIEALEKAIASLNVEITKTDYKRFEDSLNNELGKLKEEYELAISLDAEPELGYAFADMMGINMDELPRTVQEYADEYTRLLNKYLKDNKTGVELTSLNLTNDDLGRYEEMVKTGKLNEEVYKKIADGVKAVRAERKKDMESTMKDWSSLVEKYGTLQSRITKIYKESVKEQVGVVKKFGTAEEQSSAISISDKIMISDDPEEIARLQAELANLLSEITKRNPKALEVSVAIGESKKRNEAKTIWDDFKNSDTYAQMFENMANLSIGSIEMIISEMDKLRDKVKEDPASMKALIKQLEDAEKELATRNPFIGISRGIKMMKEGSDEAKKARAALKEADRGVEGAKKDVDFAKRINNTGLLEAATIRLKEAMEKQKEAQEKVNKAEDKQRRGTELLKTSIGALGETFGSISGVLDGVSSVLRDMGLDGMADSVDALNKGFTMMATVISLVSASLIILESSSPWLLAMAAALGAIVSLVAFLSGSNDEEIVENIEESERAVKRLEIAYKNLEYEIERAYGAAKWGAEQAAIANKKLQLVELKRQLMLERSRDSKHRDESKILDLQGQIVDLENDIKRAAEEIVNDLLGITSVGSAAEQLVSSMIEAFKKGEDYMQAYEDSFEKMIDNMIMKAIVSRVIGDRLQSMWDMIQEKADARTANEKEDINKIVEQQAQLQRIIDIYEQMLASASGGSATSGVALGMVAQRMRLMYGIDDMDDIYKMRDELAKKLKEAEHAYAEAATPRPEDVGEIRDLVGSWKGDVQEELLRWMEAFGISFGQDSEASLSNLQAGIQGVTEDTAGAIEAYMNGVSQQVYLHSDLLTQIRDAVVRFDIDVQTATMSQILMQLQTSYQTMQAMANLMNGWTTPNGMAIRVELNN